MPPNPYLSQADTRAQHHGGPSLTLSPQLAADAASLESQLPESSLHPTQHNCLFFKTSTEKNMYVGFLS